VVIIGAGPIGLTAALDCAARGLPVRGAGRQQHRQHRLARGLLRQAPAGDLGPPGRGPTPCSPKGVSWKVGKVFFRDELVYQFDLLPEADHKMPAMINLQQYYLEERWSEPAQRISPGRPALEAPAAEPAAGTTTMRC
jgi:3-(3-hydroxy-phenyl)propionate hydroxylase